MDATSWCRCFRTSWCGAGTKSRSSPWRGPGDLARSWTTECASTGWRAGQRALNSLYVDPDKPFHPTVPDPGLVRRLAGVIEAFRPHVVHAHSWLLYSLLPLVPTPQTRLVVWLHDQGFICPKTTFVHRGGVCSGPNYLKCLGCAKDQYGAARSFALTSGMQLMRPWRGRADRYVANSRATARAAAGHIGPVDDVLEVIPPFVPEEAFHAWARPRPAFVPKEADYLMFAGALGAHKGVDVLLRARGRNWIRNFRSSWPASDDSTPPAVSPTASCSPKRCRTRTCSRRGVTAAAAIVPSVWPEPFGAVALEAMAAGKPVVASAIEGLFELVVDGSTGILVAPGDVEALRRAMQALVDDPPLRTRMGACGQARAKTFTAEIVASAWERVFEEVIHGE